MKKLSLLALACGVLALSGCNSSNPELSKDDQAAMDKLFKEGIKHPSDNGNAGGKTAVPANQGKPLNQDAG